MHIKLLNSAQLQDFIASSAYQNMPNVPISRIRAISHCANPRADADDILLFLAMENGEMLGYLGVLPDSIFVDGNAEKIGWMSCLWISPQARGKGIAKLLIETVLKSWDNRIILTEFTPEAGKLYNRTNLFQDLAVLQGIRIYDWAKWDIWALKKVPKLRSFAFLFKGMSFLTSVFFRLLRPRFNNTEELLFMPIQDIDAEIGDFIIKKNKNTLFRRAEKELNWLTQYPWVKEMIAVVSKDTDNGNNNDIENAKRYYFSAQATLFRQKWIQVREKKTNKLCACFMLSLREDMLKTPYFYAEKEYIAPVAKWILNYMYDNQASVLLTFQAELVQHLKKNYPINYYLRPANRTYMLSKTFDLSKIQGFELQDGDGDCAFT